MLYSTLFPDAAQVIGRKFFKEPGAFDFVVPAAFPLFPGVAPKFVRASCRGVGAQGGEWGGGGAFARTKVPVAANDLLRLQVGTVSTGSTPGDSFVKRADGSVIAYADRGRGAGPGGLASNSIGDVRRDGAPGNRNAGRGGKPADDTPDFGTLIGPGFEGIYLNRSASWGGGGSLHPIFDEYSNLIGYVITPGGTGVVVLEFFDADPGY